MAKKKKTATKSDIIADGPGSVRMVPEGEGEKAAGLPRTDDHGGWINGEPATREEVEASTR